MEVTRDALGKPNTIRLKRQVLPLENIRQKGEDFFRDAVLIKKGTILAPQHLMACAACGLRHIAVKGRPQIDIFCTGDKLTRNTDSDFNELPAGKIFSSNDAFLSSALSNFGDVCFHCDASDNINSLVRAFDSIKLVYGRFRSYRSCASRPEVSPHGPGQGDA